MNDYYFIYHNFTQKFCDASNPVFIAKHTACRAIPKKAIDELDMSISDFIYDVNSDEQSKETINIMNKYWYST